MSHSRSNQSSPDFYRPPDLFIVGAARSGTTSLHNWLHSHPDVHMTWPDKEPGYYCDFWGIQAKDEYFSNFAGAEPGQIRGDASTHYLTSPASASLIYEANPKAKIIVSLRNPVERAFSLYCYMRRQGHELISTFEEAVGREDERADAFDSLNWKAYPYNFLYTRTGFYYEQLARYYAVFPRDQIYVFQFEELLRHPAEMLRDLLKFLEIREVAEIGALPRENAAHSAKSSRLQYALTHWVGPWGERLPLPGWKRGVRFLSSLNASSRKQPRPSSEMMKSLFERYREDISKTEELTGLCLSGWCDATMAQ